MSSRRLIFNMSYQNLKFDLIRGINQQTNLKIMDQDKFIPTQATHPHMIDLQKISPKFRTT